MKIVNNIKNKLKEMWSKVVAFYDKHREKIAYVGHLLALVVGGYIAIFLIAAIFVAKVIAFPIFIVLAIIVSAIETYKDAERTLDTFNNYLYDKVDNFIELGMY